MKKLFVLYAPIPRLPDFQRDLFLRTDASEYGLGAVLLQKHERKFPTAFANRKLSKREKVTQSLRKNVWL